MVQIEQGRRHGGPSTPRLEESIVERACKLACVAALIVMLVVISFVSLPVCQISGSFHHVELVQSRLSPFGRAVSNVIFDLLSLAFCVLLLWQLTRFELSSFRFGDRAPTYLATPLWIPQIAMMLGAAALCFSVVRTLAADVARLRAFGRTTEGASEP